MSERHQRVAARTHEDIVVYNYKPGDGKLPGKTAIPEFMGRVFSDTVKLQKEAAADAQATMGEIEKRIDVLEAQVMGRKEMV